MRCPKCGKNIKCLKVVFVVCVEAPILLMYSDKTEPIEERWNVKHRYTLYMCSHCGALITDDEKTARKILLEEAGKNK